jgi:RNA polymerase sigma-70 factor (ECF subfamily)
VAVAILEISRLSLPQESIETVSERRSPLEARIATHLDQGELTQAATEAVRGYGPQILVYLAAMLQDSEAARDVFSQFCENLWKGLGGFRRGSSFKTWAYQVARNAALVYMRDPYRHRVRPFEASEISRIAHEVASSSAAYLKSSAKDSLSRIRRYLDAEEQTLLLLRIDQKMSWGEIAEIMSEQGQPLSEVALRNRFQRIKAKLRRMAKAEGMSSG